MALDQRVYRGKVSYISDGQGEMGREWFTVTIAPNGDRTMRAQCEMDDFQLLRDVVVTVNVDWNPVDAFVRLTRSGRFVGSGWFRFTEKYAECEAFTVQEGRVSQRMATNGRAPMFGAHPVHNDAWRLARYDRDNSDPVQKLNGSLCSSTKPHGGSGPLLCPTSSGLKYIGAERVTVTAGSFDTEHFQFLVQDYPPIDIWAYSEDCIPVRLRWDLLGQTYELVELDR